MSTPIGVICELRPIFDAEIKFLNERLGIEIPKNTCWMNRMTIFGFDVNGKKVSLYRIRANQMELELIKDYNKLDQEFLTWEDIVENNKERLMKLENESLELIKEKMNKYPKHKKYM